MLKLFSDMSEGILGHLGEDAFYDGATTPIKINIEHGVQLSGMGGEDAQYKGDLVVDRDVATIRKVHQPRSGRSFVQNGKRYRLESKIEDNGVTVKFVVMEI